MKKLSPEQQSDLLNTIQIRFLNNTRRHEDLDWTDVRSRLEAYPEKLWSLHQMEITGGEPDLVDYDQQSGALFFYDCSAESPAGRRNLCYDHEALHARKANKPQGSAQNMAASIGIALLTEAQYRRLQTFGEFDTKTSSWIETPPEIRNLGGALFCDRRYGQIFVYHNGADSYYSSRGFRGVLRV